MMAAPLGRVSDSVSAANREAEGSSSPSHVPKMQTVLMLIGDVREASFFAREDARGLRCRLVGWPGEPLGAPSLDPDPEELGDVLENLIRDLSNVREDLFEARRQLNAIAREFAT